MMRRFIELIATLSTLAMLVCACGGRPTARVAGPSQAASSPTTQGAASTPQTSTTRARPTPTQGGTTPKPTATATPTGTFLGLPWQELTLGEPASLPTDVTLYLSSGGFEWPSTFDPRIILRVRNGPDGKLQRENLANFAFASPPQDPKKQRDFGVWSWAADDRVEEIYAMLCLGQDPCGCGLPKPAAPPALLVHSTDSGGTWSVVGQMGPRDFVAGIDSGSVVLGTKLGCSVMGPFAYWKEPGHIPIPYPERPGKPAPNWQGWTFDWRPSIGWFWFFITARQVDGSTLTPPVLEGTGSWYPAAREPSGVYWTRHSVDEAYILLTDDSGTLKGVWHFKGQGVRVTASIGEGLLVGSRLKLDAKNPDPRRRDEWIPVIIDLKNGVIHSIAGLTPGPEEPKVDLRRAVVDRARTR